MQKNKDSFLLPLFSTLMRIEERQPTQSDVIVSPLVKNYLRARVVVVVVSLYFTGLSRSLDFYRPTKKRCFRKRVVISHARRNISDTVCASLRCRLNFFYLRERERHLLHNWFAQYFVKLHDGVLPLDDRPLPPLRWLQAPPSFRDFPPGSYSSKKQPMLLPPPPHDNR